MGGLPGFYLSSREATGGDFMNFKLCIYGPYGLRNAVLASKPFVGPLFYIETKEYIDSIPKNLPV